MGINGIEELNKFKSHPPSTQKVIFYVHVEGPGYSYEETHYGFFLKDANKYLRNINRWKDVNSGLWFDDSVVTNWEYLDQMIEK